MERWVQNLLAWYARAKREMPWRGHPDPYAVWVSEIMLQQTQVETVRGYFTRFLSAFSSVADLAAADTDPLLKAWEGLGYYTRARNLRKAAQEVMTRFGGKVPGTAADLATLPGIGDYTAAAIASIAFGEAEPVVDGNVARVFARYRGLSDDFKKLPPRRKLADWLRPHIQSSLSPADFNQAMMELGALICTPRSPKCAVCPLASDCFARVNGRQADFPFKASKKEIPDRYAIACCIQSSDGKYLFMRHPGEKLLGGLWEFPGCAIPAPLPLEEAQLALEKETGLPIRGLTAHGHLKHVFSHFRLFLYLFSLPPLPEAYTAYTLDDKTFRWVDSPDELPLATAHRKAILKICETK